nr:hypothetical protein [Tanacetum cinerariifolium]
KLECWFEQDIDDEGEEDKEGEGVQVMTFMRRVLTDSGNNIGRGRDVLRWIGRVRMK